MFKKIAIAATFAAISSTAMAAEPGRIYAGADIGTTKVDGVDKRETSVGAFVGYTITPAIAVEAGYRRLADYDLSVGTASGKVTLDQISLSGVATMPLTEKFSVFGRLGYNHLEADASFAGTSADESESGVLYGVGAGYAISPTLAARVEVQRPSSDSTNVSAGLVFNF